MSKEAHSVIIDALVVEKNRCRQRVGLLAYCSIMQKKKEEKIPTRQGNKIARISQLFPKSRYMKAHRCRTVRHSQQSKQGIHVKYVQHSYVLVTSSYIIITQLLCFILEIQHSINI